MINKYLGDFVQRTERHLSVRVDLHIISQNLISSIQKTNMGNATDERIESAEGLAICSVDGL